ncbi:Autophagy-related protein 18 [Ectocarpus siliculosus]|uniref:Autophagy-related protein 18 n=1 Tax=Ectocarpus siliculosus TaxID=2880 RepID=D7G577_ECTSI|nr:Autophagy-related protein 18 [Ectocarpus siliculosus]|eukprot:CBJ27231.1 Autophagy-related protein 18 [Ectocarpus siliculosus]
MTSDDASSKEILCYGFNQDATCLAVGLRTGYRIYTCRPFAQCFAMTDGGIGRAEMLFSSSLVALVGSGDRPAFSPRRLCLWNTKKDHSICEVNFLTAVLAVKLNRKRVAVCLKTALHVFDISDMKCLRTLETAPNPDGVMALSPNEENCHLAFPDGAKAGSSGGGGEVILYNALDLKVLNKVVACRSRVVAVSFSRDGKLLATASEQGTVIRIFTVPAAVKLYTLRRGSTSCDIYSMSFNAAATRLAVSSSTRTIHIFDVSAGGAAGGAAGRRSNSSPRQGGNSGGGEQEGDVENGGGANKNGSRPGGASDGNNASSNSNSSSGLASGFRSMVGMLPNRVTKRMQDYVDCERSFASVRLRGSAGRSICALIPAGDSGVWTGKGGGGAGKGPGGRGGDESGGQGEDEEVAREVLLVVTNEGILYSYVVDTVNGGECRLDEASSLLMDPSASQEIGSELFVPERHAPPVLAGQS